MLMRFERLAGVDRVTEEMFRERWARKVLTVTITVAQQAKPHEIEVTHVGSVAQAVEAASTNTV